MPLTQPDDRRLHARQPARGRGVLLAPGLELSCSIADTSAGGLRIRTDRPLALPARATLVDVGAGLAVEVELAWRQGLDAGLKRRGEASIRGLVPSRLMAAREAWLRAGGR